MSFRHPPAPRPGALSGTAWRFSSDGPGRPRPSLLPGRRRGADSRALRGWRGPSGFSPPPSSRGARPLRGRRASRGPAAGLHEKPASPAPSPSLWLPLGGWSRSGGGGFCPAGVEGAAGLRESAARAGQRFAFAPLRSRGRAGFVLPVSQCVPASRAAALLWDLVTLHSSWVPGTGTEGDPCTCVVIFKLVCVCVHTWTLVYFRLSGGAVKCRSLTFSNPLCACICTRTDTHESCCKEQSSVLCCPLRPISMSVLSFLNSGTVIVI